MSLSIRPATTADIPVIQQIANETWPVTFGDKMSPEQLHYMMELMYGTPALEEQFGPKGHYFLLADLAGETVGFLSYELNYERTGRAKIHKIYLRPAAQGTGSGRAFVNAAETQARAAGMSVMVLDVKRDNPAVGFYEHLGYCNLGHKDTDIGNGFMMMDYVMERKL
ncbi:MAG: GNAT family N-acetyltransferase [Saprospiraceae bacterium]